MSGLARLNLQTHKKKAEGVWSHYCDGKLRAFQSCEIKYYLYMLSLNWDIILHATLHVATPLIIVATLEMWIDVPGVQRKKIFSLN